MSSPTLIKTHTSRNSNLEYDVTLIGGGSILKFAGTDFAIYLCPNYGDRFRHFPFKTSPPIYTGGTEIDDAKQIDLVEQDTWNQQRVISDAIDSLTESLDSVHKEKYWTDGVIGKIADAFMGMSDKGSTSSTEEDEDKPYPLPIAAFSGSR